MLSPLQSGVYFKTLKSQVHKKEGAKFVSFAHLWSIFTYVQLNLHATLNFFLFFFFFKFFGRPPPARAARASARPTHAQARLNFSLSPIF